MSKASDRALEVAVWFGAETGAPAQIVRIFHRAGFEFTIAEVRRSKFGALGIEYEGKSAVSSSHFSLAA